MGEGHGEGLGAQILWCPQPARQLIRCESGFSHNQGLSHSPLPEWWPFPVQGQDTSLPMAGKEGAGSHQVQQTLSILEPGGRPNS